ncbi:MAG: ATP-dependent helicase [Saprospiraceae bacterium]|nr:ATP-dependent helicase [Saprospiraceae bacterium]
MNPLIKSSEIFDREYRQLNPAQKLAVDTLDGPLLVIAGPGTGKTQILTIRIGNILLKTDADPRNILCLTYTESGAANMRKRLIQFIGATGYEVTISTFHAFCNNVIRENPDSFLHYSDYEVVSDLEKSEILLNLFQGLDRNNVLYKYNGNYSFEFYKLTSFFDSIKKENWDSQQMLQDINQWVSKQRESDEFIYKRKSGENKAGDFNSNKFEKEIIRRFEKTKAAIQLYEKYQDALDAIQRYDYEDMIKWVIKGFESDESLLQKYQERYQYIMVDEYQDTNGAQNKILFQLLNYFDRPNVFAVGDDDQAIFRFQGANVQNMFDFEHLYAPEKIVLTRNYRSSQIILDTAKKVIENNKERLIIKDASLNKDLIASGEHAGEIIRPIFTKYTDQRSEVLHVCQQIKTLIDNGTTPEQIAILYRNNKEAEPYIKWFAAEQIPYQTSKQLNLLHDLMFQHIYNLLAFLVKNNAAPFQQDDLLFKILHAPFISLNCEEISRLAYFLSNEKKKRQQEQERETPGPDYSLMTLMGDTSRLSQAGIQNFNGCQELSALLNKFQKEIYDHTPQVFLEKLLLEFNVLNFILSKENRVELLNVLNTFFEFIKLESQRNPKLTVEQLIYNLDSYQSNNIGIPLIPFGGSLKGVHLSTLHKAKGQEYQYVFMINCTQQNWSAKNVTHFKLPDSYINQNIGADEDDRRLFYVGITRAKCGIYLSYAAAKEKSEHVPCKYISEMFESGLMDERTHMTDPIDYSTQLVVDMSPIKKDFKELEDDYFNHFLESFYLNPTALSKYLNCPLSFYYENVLRIPGARTPALGYGKAVHDAFEQYMKNTMLRKTVHKEALLRYFNKGMEKVHSHFTSAEFDNYKAEGERVLVGFLEQFSEDWNQALDYEIEFSIKTEINGIPISGKLDRIDILPNGLRVVDYKTGKPNPKDKMNEPSDKNPYGGNYWQQMVFYAVLLKNHSKYHHSSVTTAFYYVQPDKEKNKYMKVEIDTTDHIPFLTQLIQETYSKIKNKIFTPGCGKESCEWCKYINSGAAIEFLSVEEDLEE